MISVTDAEFDQAVGSALDSIPEDFRRHLENVTVEVVEKPDAALRAEFPDVDDVLGLYVGVPLEEKGGDGAPYALPDRVLIFRENLCAACDTVEELREEIRITVLHEIGHHFGLDEDALSELGYG